MAIPNSEIERLCARAAEMMAAQQLPTVPSSTILAGYGNGAPCSLCGQPINPTQIEYEIADPSVHARTRMHLGCHLAWQIELTRISAAAAH